MKLDLGTSSCNLQCETTLPLLTPIQLKYCFQTSELRLHYTLTSQEKRHQKHSNKHSSLV